MIRKYFTTGWRNIGRHKLSSILNVFGLSLGLALFIFIGLFLHDQYRYDRWYEDSDRIYRLEFGEWGVISPAYKRLAEGASAGVEEAVRLNNIQLHNSPLRKDGDVIRIQHLIAADPAVFDFFGLKFLHGDAQTALDNINSIVLTRSEATRLFGKENPVGEVLRLRDQYNLVVTGVVEDISHFHIKMDAFISFMIFGEFFGNDYFESPGDWNHFTYVKLHQEACPVETHSQIEEAALQFIYETAGIHFDMEVRLRPVKDIYYTQDVAFESRVIHGNRTISVAFMLIACFVLFIAIVNFINLSTAHAFARAKETGIRKLLGGSRKSLVLQFLAESVMITIIAMLGAILLVEIFLPDFNNLAGVDISLGDWSAGFLIVAFLLSSIIIGFLNGIYPAFFLSGFRAAKVLKGELTRSKGAALFRKGLMVFQFAIGIALIAGTIIVFDQVWYMQNKEMEYNKEDVLFFRSNTSIRQSWSDFRHDLLSVPHIREVSLTNTVPGNVGWQESVIKDGQAKQFYYWPATPEYFSMLGVDLLAGRWPDRKLPTDQHSNVVVNQQWLRLMGFDQSPEEVLGASVQAGIGRKTIIGVVPDFHFNSLHKAIAPLMFVWDDNRSQMVSIHLESGAEAKAIDHINLTYAAYYPDEPLSYQLLDDSISDLYDDENRLGVIFGGFSVFAILIASLGLFGLSSFLIEKRSKEIAIRKVMGASLLRLHLLLQKEFFVLVMMAALIAVPAGWYFMSRWLTGFPYHISLGIAPFVVAVMVALFIALATVSWHAHRVANKNPGDFMRTE